MTTPDTPPLRRRPSAAAVRLARPVLAAGCILFSTTALRAADGRVVGRVSDAATQAALPGAEVTVAGSSARAVTGPDGSFTLSLPPGEYQLSSYYLGYPAQTIPVVVADGATAPAKFSLGSSEVVTLETFTVEGSREGQARALNQQRTSQNLVNIVSADLAGQFPDKTIADAVKRLPGVTVETDTDTGGSEGRYITIRGMNADFNAVSINGMRASVSDFGGLSRRVPLDVVSAKSADQIEVTKALRPDQDGDGIGGAVNIVTRSPFDREGYTLSAEAALTYRDLLNDYTGNYPFDNPGAEASVTFGSPLGTKGTQAVLLSVNHREDSFVKQRVGTTGWSFDGTAYSPSGTGGTGVAIQHFFDDLKSTGINGTYEWRPNVDNRFRIDFSYSERDTERGRQRLFYRFFDGTVTNAADEVSAADTNGDGTYDRYTSDFTRVDRIVRQFFEKQALTNIVARGETKAGDWKFDYSLGANRGSFDGDPKRDINARFESTSSGTTSYRARGDTPVLGFSGDEYNPNLFRMRSLDRSSSSVTDDELAAGLDATREATLFGGEGFWKAGVKSRLFDREYTKTENFFFRNNNWRLDTGPAGSGVGSSVADYRATSTLGGAYDYGFFIDPDKLRANANALDEAGLLSGADDNALRARANSYDAAEDIHATYGMGQFAWGGLTALGGARVEFTRVNFTGANADVNADGDYFGTARPYDITNDYADVLPGFQLRYEQNKNLIYRLAVTRSIARPRLSDLAPISKTDDFDFEIKTGNPNLDPTTSTNFDLGAEYYLSSAGSLTFGLFYKDMKDNIYTARSARIISGETYSVISPTNADSAWVGGFEIGYDQQFTFLPAPLDGLGAFFNYTYADSEVDTGLAAFAGTDLPLFNQVQDTINAGLFYDRKGVRARVSLLYRSESLIEIQTDSVDKPRYDPALSRYLDSSLTLDLTASYEFAKGWLVFTQFQNLLDEPGQAYNGTKARLDYNEVTDWSATLGLRWNL